MYQGSCLCGSVKYQLKSHPKAITNCHCTMCQKQHGAAFSTYGSVPTEDLIYQAGNEVLATYRSSENVSRRFCGECGSSIEWSGSLAFSDWVSIAIATLDSPLQIEKIRNVNLETKACWLDAS